MPEQIPTEAVQTLMRLGITNPALKETDCSQA